MKRMSWLVILAVLAASSAYADSVYLKGGSVLKGKIVKEEETAVMLETEGAWKKVDRTDIEHIVRDEAVAGQAKPADAAAVPVKAEGPPSRTITDLRVKFGGVPGVTEVGLGSNTVSFQGTGGGNFQVEAVVGMYGRSNAGLVLSAGIFAKQHSGRDNAPFTQTTVDYFAAGVSLGLGLGLKASEQLHFEIKAEACLGAGSPTFAPGTQYPTEAGGYGSLSGIVGVYYTFDRPGVQIGLELGGQSFSGDFQMKNSAGQWRDGNVNGGGGMGNVVLGYRF